MCIRFQVRATRQMMHKKTPAYLVGWRGSGFRRAAVPSAPRLSPSGCAACVCVCQRQGSTARPKSRGSTRVRAAMISWSGAVPKPRSDNVEPVSGSKPGTGGSIDDDAALRRRRGFVVSVDEEAGTTSEFGCGVGFKAECNSRRAVLLSSDTILAPRDRANVFNKLFIGIVPSSTRAGVSARNLYPNAPGRLT